MAPTAPPAKLSPDSRSAGAVATLPCTSAARSWPSSATRWARSRSRPESRPWSRSWPRSRSEPPNPWILPTRCTRRENRHGAADLGGVLQPDRGRVPHPTPCHPSLAPADLEEGLVQATQQTQDETIQHPALTLVKERRHQATHRGFFFPKNRLRFGLTLNAHQLSFV